MLLAHGTKYNLLHEPFVAFDIMYNKHQKISFDIFKKRISLGDFIMPTVISDGLPISIDDALSKLGKFGFHGAIEPIEGAVWRIERNKLNDKSKGNISGRTFHVDFLVKYVNPEKIDGKYLKGETITNSYK